MLYTPNLIDRIVSVDAKREEVLYQIILCLFPFQWNMSNMCDHILHPVQ